MAPNVGIRQPFVIGAKTRLARELVAQLQADSASWSMPVLLSRSPAEIEELRDTYPNCEIVVFDQMANTTSKRNSDPSVLFCCALGPIHPTTQSQPISDLQAVEKELEFLRALRATLSGHAHVVFVSTVLAISSGSGRYYYSGWKRLIEAAIHELMRDFPDTHVSVVYPGRLVEAKNSIPSWLSTTYGCAAQIMVKLGRSSSTRRIIGIDSRLLLLKRVVETTWSAISGNVH